MSEVKNSDFATKLHQFWENFCRTAKKAKNRALTGLASWLDPKLQHYLPENQAQSLKHQTKDPKIQPNQPQNHSNTVKMPPQESLGAPETKESTPSTSFAKNRSGSPEISLEANSAAKSPDFSTEIPTSRAEFLEILHNIPLSVFSRSQRKQLETIMNIDLTTVSELMLPENRIVYVDQDEMLGPLTLDRLFRSGLKHFPVTDRKNQIVGCIHTARLNSLDIKQSEKARDILDPNVYYVREDYTLEQALEVFLRTESYFLLVVDHYGKITGILNFSDFADFLFGKLKNDGFLHDDDHLAVAKRHFEQKHSEPDRHFPGGRKHGFEIELGRRERSDRNTPPDRRGKDDKSASLERRHHG